MPYDAALPYTVVPTASVQTCARVARPEYITYRIVICMCPCTVNVASNTGAALQPAPRHVLAGHSDAVMCLAVDSGLDLVISAAADGIVLMHTLRTGR